MANLFDSFLPRGKIIDPAVSDMAEVHPAGGKPAHTQGGAHARAIRIGGAEVHQGFVNFGEKLFEHVLEIRGKPYCGSLEGRRKQPRDLFHCDSAGELSRHCPSHTIAYGKNEIDAF